MWSPDAMCAEYDRPEGVIRSFQVCRYSIEPTMSNRAFNLFTKDDVRATLVNEVKECWPEMPLIFNSFLFPGGTEGLTGARARPDGIIGRPSGKLERVTPTANPGKEVALGIIFNFLGGTFRIDLSSTSPSGMSFALINSLNHAAAFGSNSL